MGNEIGSLGIPCQDFLNGCRCTQCENARQSNLHQTIGNELGNSGIGCQDMGRGCECNQCIRAREFRHRILRR